MLYGSDTWLVKEADMISQERNDASMVKWMWNISFEDSISAEELKIEETKIENQTKIKEHERIFR